MIIIEKFMELTREYFDKGLKGLDKRLDGMATKEDLAGLAKSTKKDLEEGLKAQTKELKAFAVAQTEELARIVNNGFDDVLDRLDVRERMAKMEKKMMKIEQALHMEIEV